ncbi:unnamed protein product [Polarella glacialis]|uniref:non-specific serine/threonine protein kinase n=1 Tax=Polarella glacialis TaxID=89957 RepID=A0A813LA05_POLGL|nr:unnamed protein product [Polarella glacialis]
MADPRAEKSSRAKSIGHYILMKTIGEGTFGKVKLGTHILTGERVAVKVLEKERIVDIADVERVAREIHILKLIRQCRHIIQLYEIIETPRQLYLIMEYACGGELFDYIVEKGRAEERDACRFLHQILAGVERVHTMNVVHRDLKPENLLLTDRQDIKIVDFGLSNTYQDGQLLQTACGSPCYAAPEMIAGLQYVPSMVDVWSCGVILFALVCGYLPFEDQNHAELYKKILNAEYEMPDFVSREVADLISGMLTTDPAQRITLEDIRKHAWYQQIPEASLIDREDIGCLDEDILDQLDNYGFPRDYAVKCLMSNKHNHVTTTYYLIKEKRLREQHAGSCKTTLAVADIDATCYEDTCGAQAFNGHVSAAAAVAGVATPSRGRAGEVLSSVAAGEGPQAARHHRGDFGQEAGYGTVNAACGMRSQGRAALNEGGHLRSSSQPPVPSSARCWSGAHPRVRPNGRASDGWGTPRAAGPLSARGPGLWDDQGATTTASSTSRRRPLSVDPCAVSRRTSPRATGGLGYGARWTDGVCDIGGAEFEAQASPNQRPLSARQRLHADSAAAGPWSRPPGVPPAACGGGRPLYSSRGSSGVPGDDSAPGAFQVSCSSSRSPRHIVQEAMQSFGSHGISFRQTSNFVVRCQSQGVRFQAEVLQLDRGGGFALRFTRASGDVRTYKDLCARLLADMNL